MMAQLISGAFKKRIVVIWAKNQETSNQSLAFMTPGFELIGPHDFLLMPACGHEPLF